MKYTVIFMVVIGLAVVGFLKYYYVPVDTGLAEYSDWKKIVINHRVLKLEVVRSLIDREVGLSGRTTLSIDTGMLFVFDRPGLHGFWMKGMKFPIDIIWFDEDLKVIDIKEGADPAMYPENYVPQDIAKFVLETNADFVSYANVKIGDQAQILK
jgi:uncharacterized membrane protein (UPF0127 family)